MNFAGLQQRLGHTADELRAARICARAGLLPLDSLRVAGAARAWLRAYGSLGGAIALAAARFGDRTALIDEDGTLTFMELDERSNAVANAWRARGLKPGEGVAILARNHRGFFDAFFAAQKLGARTVLLNTDFSGPQLAEVAAREGTRLLTHDDEFSERVAGVAATLGTYLSWSSGEHEASLDTLRRTFSGAPPPAPSRHGSLVILTSGTTGTPKGATRSSVSSLQTPAAILSAMPMRGNAAVLIAPPVFHSMGFGASILLFGLGATVVLQRRFDATAACELIERHQIQGLFAVPIMLSRMLDSVDANGHDVSSLKYVLAAGSQLGAPLAERALSTLGPVLYNMYGSTEVAYATIAHPAHLRRAPSTVGPPAFGTRVRLIDDDGHDVPVGTTGRILVGNAIPFEGYTGGGDKQRLDGLVATGDVGHFDADGLMFIDGRDDSMIVSGGENVFPDEVESLLEAHPDVREASVVGVPDDEYGQRLRAFVVLQEGAETDADGLKAYVRANLARYKVPRDVAFLDRLPRTPTGKVLKRDLPPEV
jgi:fatty-acyl-CoA synthase